MSFSVSSYFADKACYFAAANGYEGFRSYFREVFVSECFDHIFVLKGGPGTGKSRLMRSVGEVFESRGCQTEWIFCSSDPTSLDGVILRENGRQIAMLDGTAPHERDAVIPGAVDTLVNLGEGWDEEALLARRPDIQTLGRVKSKAYQKAYEYLSFCSKYRAKTKAEIKKAWDEEELRSAARAFLGTRKSERRPTVTQRPIRAFCRYGLIHLPTLEHMAERVYLPSCDRLLRAEVLRVLAEEAHRMSISFLRAPSPLCDEDTDALFFTEDRIAVLAYTPVDEKNTVSLPVPGTKMPCPTSSMLLYDEITRELLLKAEHELSLAAEAHASLEEIYTAAMDFGVNNRLIETLISRIERILY